MYGIYANIGGILMVNVTIYSIHGSYGYVKVQEGNWCPGFQTKDISDGNRCSSERWKDL